MQFNNLQELQNIIIKFPSKEVKNHQELDTTIKATHQEFLNVILKSILSEINVLQKQLTKNANDPLLAGTNQKKQEKMAALYWFQKEIEILQSKITEISPNTIVIEHEKNKINLLFQKIIDHLSQQEIANFKKLFEGDLKKALKSLSFQRKTIEYRLKINPNNIQFTASSKFLWEKMAPKKIQKMILSNKQKKGIEIANWNFLSSPSNKDYAYKKEKDKQLRPEKREETLEELNEIKVANMLKITAEKEATQKIEMVTLTTRQENLKITKKENVKKLNEIKDEIKYEEIEMNEIKNNPISR
ncbi:hypothetical protein [Spiroplasma eriocheiris]|uniref:Uncharacterized protein n=1 Tax=Spiroplasma eriocheiris TaxID=315358 RepID=A0A0H3XJL7_9MOLU|nr:hypothetical protein [Spiroplasma eriocheiris]AHF57589.1 hypothetical protein SPE_0460 [Spiroplasma eriocheiris CCTCC M 207170]AKM54046.1 hypothetical protein SERIO_v1c04670 [Spiroplasma eriocheiris]